MTNDDWEALVLVQGLLIQDLLKVLQEALPDRMDELLRGARLRLQQAEREGHPDQARRLEAQRVALLESALGSAGNSRRQP